MGGADRPDAQGGLAAIIAKIAAAAGLAAGALRRLTGWRRWLVALALGALGALALPPVGAWPMLWVAFGGIVWLLDGCTERICSPWRRARAGAAVMWWFALGWFGASLWWIGAAFLVDAERFLWLMPLAVLAMPAGLALFWGLAGGVLGLVWRRHGWRIVLLAGALAGAEALRGHVLGGFPWNMPAHALDGLLPLQQVAAIAGVEGLSFLVVLWAALPGLLADGPGRRGVVLLGGAALALALAFGLWRLAGGAQAAPAGGVLVRIVQPAVAQREKWKPANREVIFARLLRLGAQPRSDGRRPDIIVWPESAVPFLLDESPAALKQIGDMLAPGQILLTGAIRRAGRHGGLERRLRNSLMAVDDGGRIIAIYDKRKLVPFGEFLPLGGVLEPLGIRRLVSLPGGFLPGRGNGRIALPGLPAAGGMICYEAIFPALAAGEWLVNVTNDAWFGRTAGPWQHLAAARLTAIASGRPMVRAANTGISAVIDARGRIIARLGLMRRGVIDAVLPLPAGRTASLAR